MRNIVFITTTICLTLISSLLFAGTVYSQSNENERVKQEYYKEAAKEYADRINELLEEHDCYNSGINMTYTTMENQTREYKILIHHHYIDLMDEETKILLKEEIEELAFEDSACSFSVEFLEYE